MNRRRGLGTLLVAALAAGAGFWGGRSGLARVATPPALASGALPAAGAADRGLALRSDLGEDEKSTIARFEQASPSVVFITSIALRQDAFRLNLLEIPQGTGSGFVWDREGHVVTNYHVVANANAAKVTLADQSTWDAHPVGFSPEKDLAVLKIDAPAERLRPLPIGSSTDLRVGQKVLAIGNPFGLDQTLTTGVISALGREIDSMASVPIRDVIQTDAAINPGNSGGPLLDGAGRLIGVNTAIFSPGTGTYAGIGFAIPAHAVSVVVPDLIAYGRVRRPSIGVELAAESMSRRLGLDGAVVVRVERGSAAARAGLDGLSRDLWGRWTLGDVIQEIDGQPIRSNADLMLALEEKKIGAKVEVAVLRDGRTRRISLVLDEDDG
jgi:S1-C subfamily serine protease